MTRTRDKNRKQVNVSLRKLNLHDVRFLDQGNRESRTKSYENEWVRAIFFFFWSGKKLGIQWHWLESLNSGLLIQLRIWVLKSEILTALALWRFNTAHQLLHGVREGREVTWLGIPEKNWCYGRSWVQELEGRALCDGDNLFFEHETISAKNKVSE